MTAVREPGWPRSVWIALAVASAAYLVVVGFALSFGTTLGNSVDMGFHLQILEYLRHHLFIPAEAEPVLKDMYGYPRWSHRLAAVAAAGGLSGLNALGFAATLSAGFIWLVLFAMARGISRLLLPAALVSAASAAMITGAVFGGEIVINYFYPQIVGEAASIGLLAVGVWISGRSRYAFAAFAVLAVWVCGQFHLVPTLRLAAGLGVVLLADLARAPVGRRLAALPWLAVLPAMAAAIVLNPAFAALRTLSAVNGGITFAAPLTLGALELATAALVLVCLALLALDWRAPNPPPSRRRGLVFFAALGLAAAAAFLAQDLALRWLHEGSEYAVKKHAFGLITALAFAAPTLAVALPTPPALRRRLEIAASIALAAGVAIVAWILWRKLMAPGVYPPAGIIAQARFALAGLTLLGLAWLAYRTARAAWSARGEAWPFVAVSVAIAQLTMLSLLYLRPSQLDVPRVSSILETTAALRPIDRYGEGFLFVSTQSPSVVGYITNMAALRVDRHADPNFPWVFLSGDAPNPERVPNLVTETGDPTYDVAFCRRGPQRGPIVVVDGACVAGRRYDFRIGGNGAALLKEGWTGPEEVGAWSDGPRAVIELPLSPASDPEAKPRLLIRAAGFIPPESPRRTIRFAIEGGPEQSYAFDRQGMGDYVLRLEIPPEAVQQGKARIVFDIDDPAPHPDRPGHRLGVAVMEMTVYPKSTGG